MTTFEQIQERHAALEKALAVDPDSVRTGQITNLLAQIQETAVTVADEEQRQTLTHILTRWAGVAEQRGEKPVAAVLAAYLPPAPPAAVAPTPPVQEVAPVAQEPLSAAKAPRRPLINWSSPPEWMLQGLTLLIIAVLAVAGYYIMAYYVDSLTKTSEPSVVEPTLEPTVAVAAVEETAVIATLPPPTAVLVEVITVDTAPTAAATTAPQRTHIVGTGDTLSTIATRYGVTIDEIIAANALLNPNQLEIGQTLAIPFPGQPTVAAPEGTETAQTIPTVAPPTAVPEVVVRGVDITAVIPLYINPSTASQPVATLSSGTFAKALGLSEDRSWYLVELSDGSTRGWVTVDSADLLYPATPDQLPLLRVVNQ
ncbi:MAG: LysM peptidoglycan-binding domain-containing protein [Anaerolineales bacterium]|nr:LysM peptidoglycan-binding domain-containing protein [Anaerolineales bacterium]